MRRAWIVLALGAFVAAAPAQQAHGQSTIASEGTEAGSALSWHDCVYEHDDQSTVLCGRLLINSQAPASLPIVIVQHDPAIRSESAILYLEGGPGGSSRLELHQFAWSYWAKRAGLTQDLVVYDQRGTGLADPSLDCAEFRDAVRGSLAAGMFSEAAMTLQEEATAACYRRLIAEGHDLEQFTTLRNSADIVALMDALPYSDWTLFGASYGSRLALEVMRMQPEGLRSVILDGVLPPDLDWWVEEPDLLDDVIAKMDASCATEQVKVLTCDVTSDGFRRSLDDVLNGLSNRPRWIAIDDWTGNAPYKVKIDPPVLLYALHDLMAYPDSAVVARNAVIEAARGNTAFIDLILDYWVQWMIGDDLHEPVYFSVLCDIDSRWTDADFRRRAAQSRYYAAYIDQPSYFFPCDYWTTSRAPDGMREPVSSAVPTLLFSGEYDPLTPAAWGDRVAASLENGHHFVVPRGGHGALFENSCAMGIMNAFLSDPTAAPIAQCLEDMARNGH